MSLIYINEDGVKVSISENRMVISYKNEMTRYIPIESVDALILLGKSQITTQCMEQCLKKGIPISFFSKGGVYFGRLMSTGHIKAPLQRKQAALYDSGFATKLSSKIVENKIHNQLVVLRRYAHSVNIEIQQEEGQMRNAQKKVCQTDDISQIIGYEGVAARYYFQGLSRSIKQEFTFEGRNRRPPRDPFNSLISLGYSVIMNSVYEEIENKGLNPYFGFMHRDAEKHPTLASDMMEEWRAVLVDSTAMSLINGNELKKENFYIDENTGGCYINKDGLEIFLKKMERKMQTENKYLEYVDYAVNFRRAIGLQIARLVNAIENENPDIYIPIRIR